MMTGLTPALDAICAERARQNEKWGEQNHGNYEWLAILSEEIGEVAQAMLKSDPSMGEFTAPPSHIREELAQVAAVAVAWIECIDRRAQ